MEKENKVPISSYVLFGLLCVCILYSSFLLFRTQSPQVMPSGREIVLEEKNKETSSRAYIGGAVANPGVYKLDEFTLVIDLVDRAGGFSESADYSFIAQKLNLAKRVFNEDHIYIPPKSSNLIIENQDVDKGPIEISGQGVVDINNATQTQMETLPGVGPKTAELIIENRPYSKVEDIKEVKGIGEATYEKLEPYITV